MFKFFKKINCPFKKKQKTHLKSKIFLSSLVGALVGGTAVFFGDPKNGSKRRTYLKNQASQFLEDFKENFKFENLKTRSLNFFDQVKSVFSNKKDKKDTELETEKIEDSKNLKD